jgi:hypothetical protein
LGLAVRVECNIENYILIPPGYAYSCENEKVMALERITKPTLIRLCLKGNSCFVKISDDLLLHQAKQPSTLEQDKNKLGRFAFHNASIFKICICKYKTKKMNWNKKMN